MVVRGSESKRVELENIFHPHSIHWFWLRHLPYRMTLSTCVLQNGFKSRFRPALVLRTLRLETGTTEWAGLADGRPVSVSQCYCRSHYRIWAGQYYRLGGVKLSWKNSYEGVRFNVIIGGGGGIPAWVDMWVCVKECRVSNVTIIHHGMRRQIVTYWPKS